VTFGQASSVIGSAVSHYRILEKLGEGGMGIVYKAQDTRLERLVALKFLPDRLSVIPSIRERFIREARAASALNHPNVAVVYDVGDDGPEPFIAMELIEGETLRSRLAKGPVPVEQVRIWCTQVAEGLQAAHAKGIVHRDIKPDNLLLASAGAVKIMDFGIARLSGSDLTTTGVALGTLAYMSPEQMLGNGVDHRSDLWSLGVVMYEMLAGRLPFDRENAAATMYEILNVEPVPVESVRLDTPASLAALVNRLLAKEPAQRPDSAGDVIAALRDTGPPAETDVPDKSIAVLYFENMSSDPESDYYCAGITEDILTDLSKLDELSVVSRTDVLPFRGKHVNIRQAAEALRVHYVLEGSVRKAGGRIRITAQLIDARNGYHVWADRFDGLVDDIFDLQAEVANQIARALKGSLTDADEASLARRPTDDVRAYDFYMRGREYLNRRGKANTEAALRMFERALEIDGNFADAFAALGEACAYMYEWYDGDPGWLTRAIAMDKEALDREPASVEALFGLAMIYFHQGRFADARRTLLSVLENDSQHVPARIRLGMLAERTAADGTGLAEAVALYRQAAELRPNEEEAWRCLAAAQRKLGNQDAVQEAALNVIEITSRKLEASLEDVILLSRLGEAYARFSAREEAVATIQRVLELAPADGLALYNCASAYALLGDVGRSLTLLRRAYDAGFRGVINAARADSSFEILHAQSDFRRLVAELC
jgi:serine/threonine protein kinase/tetratricopeptide (TPR) repeat protein